MKHLCITYHMERPNEIAENCITLPMVATIAAEIMEHQEEIPLHSAGDFQ